LSLGGKKGLKVVNAKWTYLFEHALAILNAYWA
jgi:hypothetical protein